MKTASVILALWMLLAQSNAAQTLNPGVVVYSKTNWTDLSDFTVSGFTPTVSGGVIHFPTGVTDWNRYLLLNSLTNMDLNWQIEVSFKVTGISNFGVGIGRQSANPVYPTQLRVLLFGEHQYINNGSAVWNVVDRLETGFSTVAVNDVIYERLQVVNNLITFCALDTTTGFGCTVNYADPLGAQYGTNGTVSDCGNFALFNVSSGTGTMDIVAIKVTTFAPTNWPLAFLGDSKMIYSAGGLDASLPALVSRRLGFPPLFYCGPGDRTQELLSSAPYLTNYAAPKKVVLGIGRNDIAFGVSNSVWQANYTNLVNTLTGAGIGVVHLLPVPEVNLNQSALRSFIIGQYGYTNCIDPAAMFTTNTMISADGVHPNAAGHQALADLITGSGLLK